MFLTEPLKKRPLLEVDNLSVSLKKPDLTFEMVKDLHFKLESGKTLGIVGESGSGKTAAMLGMLGLMPRWKGFQVKGNAFFDSPSLGILNLVELPSSQIRKVRGNELALIFQDPMAALNPLLPCGQQVAEILKLHFGLNGGGAKAQVLQLFEEVKLPDPLKAWKAYPHELSGGQQQRVMIAGAIACRPSVLIADEPTTSLDVSTQASILALFHELQAAYGMGLIFITHDLNVVAEMADDLLVLQNGLAVERGKLWNVFSFPQHPYTKGLLAARPRLDLNMRELPVLADFLRDEKMGKGRHPNYSRFHSVGEAIMLNYQLPQDQWDDDPEPAPRPLMEVKDLHVSYPLQKDWWGRVTERYEAVKGVSFEVAEGETLGLVGASGSGKSSLAASLLCLKRPQQGEIWFDGQPMLKLSSNTLKQVRSAIQVIFQDPYASLNPHMTIGEAVLEPIRVYNPEEPLKEQKEHAIDLLEMVNISASSFDRFPHEFSGGQRQRICIARALAMNPRMLICDEPLSALDVSVQAHILNLLNYLKEKFKLTLLFISHDMSVVKFFSDRVMVMEAGKIVEIGTAQEVFNQPKHSCTQSLLEAVPNGSLESIRKKILLKKLS